jgi:hypothetical protein
LLILAFHLHRDFRFHVFNCPIREYPSSLSDLFGQNRCECDALFGLIEIYYSCNPGVTPRLAIISRTEHSEHGRILEKKPIESLGTTLVRADDSECAFRTARRNHAGSSRTRRSSRSDRSTADRTTAIPGNSPIASGVVRDNTSGQCNRK